MHHRSLSVAECILDFDQPTCWIHLKVLSNSAICSRSRIFVHILTCPSSRPLLLLLLIEALAYIVAPNNANFDVYDRTSPKMNRGSAKRTLSRPLELTSHVFVVPLDFLAQTQRQQQRYFPRCALLPSTGLNAGVFNYNTASAVSLRFFVSALAR